MKEEQLKELTFDEIRKILIDPFRVLVQEGTWAYICTYGSETIEVIEEVFPNHADNLTDFFKILSDEELDTLYELLNKVYKEN